MLCHVPRLLCRPIILLISLCALVFRIRKLPNELTKDPRYRYNDMKTRYMEMLDISHVLRRGSDRRPRR